MTHKELARRIGMNRITLYKKLNKRSEFTITEINAILKEFPGYSYETLFMQIEPPEPDKIYEQKED